MATRTQPTQGEIKDGQQIADARGDPDPRPGDDAAGMTSERAQELMVALVRQGQDASLRSLQVWAELARKVGPHPRSSPADATVAALAYDPFKALLTAQRQVVDQLVATQRDLAQQHFRTPPPSART